MSCILVPLDGSLHALKALTIACDLGQKYEIPVILTNVINEEQSLAPVLKSPLARAFDAETIGLINAAVESGHVPFQLREIVGRTILETAAAKVKNKEAVVKIGALGSGNPIEAIIEMAVHCRSNMIVMGCRGHSKESFGSVAYGVMAQFEGTVISVK